MHLGSACRGPSRLCCGGIGSSRRRVTSPKRVVARLRARVEEAYEYTSSGRPSIFCFPRRHAHPGVARLYSRTVYSRVASQCSKGPPPSLPSSRATRPRRAGSSRSALKRGRQGSRREIRSIGRTIPDQGRARNGRRTARPSVVGDPRTTTCRGRARRMLRRCSTGSTPGSRSHPAFPAAMRIQRSARGDLGMRSAHETGARLHRRP